MAKKSKTKKPLDRIVGRPKPSAPTAGYLASGRRYEKGGKRGK